MDIITLTPENLEKEHICCAISSNKDCQVLSKKQWLSERFEDGLTFHKGNVRGKCFIEYIPAEKAWAPIEAQGYMYIDCLWVAGRFQGQGWAAALLEKCIADSRAKGKKGIAVLSAKKKTAYLSDPTFLQHKGFQPVDEAAPYFVLYALPFDKDAVLPRFQSQVKSPHSPQEGFVVYYTNQCPFPAKYVPLMEKLAAQYEAPLRVVRYTSSEEARAGVSPWSTFTLFYNGSFVTHEILSENRFGKILTEKGFSLKP